MRIAVGIWLKSENARDVTKRVITNGNHIVSGRNYDILTLVITQLLMSPPLPDLGQNLPFHNPTLRVEANGHTAYSKGCKKT